MNYEAKTFDLPSLTGLSEKQIKAHLGLYEGYVKHVNLIAETLSLARAGKTEMDPYAADELRRRYSFEFNGMRMHEYYFEQFEGGHKLPNMNSALTETAKEKYGPDALIKHMKDVADTRGIGWVVAYADTRAGRVDLQTVFVADHELGQLAGLPIIAALDMWEHAYMLDYAPAEKKNYVEAFFANINWEVCEARFNRAMA